MYQRRLIRETLSSDESLEFVEASNGKQGLEQARLTPPDVILLDVMMPGLNGFQVCRVIKADSVLRAAPVLLVTALGQTRDRVDGLDSGADDFVNKPFEEAELQARVRSALRQKALHDQLKQVSQMRDTLVKMIMHDMGNLISVVGSALTLYQRLPPDSAQAAQFVHDALEANLALGDMVNDALDVSSLEVQRMPLNCEETNLVALLQSVTDAFRGAATENDVRLDIYIDPELSPQAYVDKGLVRRVISNLLTNALKFAPEHSAITVILESGSEADSVKLSVSDEGPGIAPEDQARIFNKYEQAQRYVDHRGRPGRGLGLTFSKLAVEAHRGAISVNSTPGSGATFTVELPRR
jgi:signal transduction histidine kinase